MAGSRIRGITIEIGGDTTKLTKALSMVDKSLGATKTTLKDVDRLLKLDPKNTELLTQKQKGLQDAVDLTKVRLEALKEAQEDVSKGSSDWDALQREIIATEGDLKSLEKQQSNFGSVAAQVIAAAGQQMQDFGQKVQDAGKKFAPLSAAAGGIVGGMVGLGYGSITAADDLNTLSKQTGLSTDSLQKMKYASDLVDVSVEDITGAVTKMKKGMASAPDAFESLGVSVTNADGSMRDAESVFTDTLKALSEIDNETERDQKAYEIFGKSADQLAGIIDDGGAALKEYGDQAEELGLIMSGDTLDALNEVNDKVDQSKAQIGAAAGELGATIMEGLLPLVDPIVEGIQKVTEFIKNLTPEQTNLILAIAGAVAVIGPLLTIIGGIISAVGTIMSLAPVIMGVLGAILSPIGLVVAAIAAVIAIIVLCVKHWDQIKEKVSEVVENIKEFVSDLKEKIQQKFEEIKQQISQKIDTVKSDMSAKWNQIKSDVVEKVTGMKNDVVNKIVEWKNKIVEKLNDIKSKFTEKFNDIKDKVKGVVDDIKGFFEGLKLKIPKPEMPDLPHFSLRTSTKTVFGKEITYPSGIDVDWYAKAMDMPYLFTNPTVMQTPYGTIGAGEAGHEIMYGRDNLMRDITEANAVNNASLVNGFYHAMVAALKSADITVDISGREFGRILREAGVK